MSLYVYLLFIRWEAAKQMEEDINTGTTLIVDRYAYSGIAFSHAKVSGCSLSYQYDRVLLYCFETFAVKTLSLLTRAPFICNVIGTVLQ